MVAQHAPGQPRYDCRRMAVVEVTTTKEPERVQVSSLIHKHSEREREREKGLKRPARRKPAEEWTRVDGGRVAAGWNGASVFRIVMGERKLTGPTRSFPSLDPTPISKRVTGDCFRLLPVCLRADSAERASVCFTRGCRNNAEGVQRRWISHWCIAALIERILIGDRALVKWKRMIEKSWRNAVTFQPFALWLFSYVCFTFWHVIRIIYSNEVILQHRLL